MSEHNYRVLTPVGWFTCDTQERLEKEITLLSCVPFAEFYQPGIGWVKYTPQPVDYAAIIRRLVAAGDGYVEYSMKGIPEAWVEAVEAWENIRNSAEVKKVLGEA
jgi:hypothetical protein